MSKIESYDAGADFRRGIASFDVGEAGFALEGLLVPGVVRAGFRDVRLCGQLGGVSLASSRAALRRVELSIFVAPIRIRPSSHSSSVAVSGAIAGCAQDVGVIAVASVGAWFKSASCPVVDFHGAFPTFGSAVALGEIPFSVVGMIRIFR